MTKNKIRSELTSWVMSLGLAFIAAYLLGNFIILNALIPSGSMEPTIMTNDRLIANRLSYVFSEPQRLDIIIFRPPHDLEIDYVKRVIGLPGDIVNIIEGDIYVNGELLEHANDFIKEDFTGSFGPYFVGENEYFVLGDNRNNSSDSRFWAYPFASGDEILGKAIFRYYPSFEILH